LKEGKRRVFTSDEPGLAADERSVLAFYFDKIDVLEVKLGALTPRST
jgi:hypothetical protein